MRALHPLRHWLVPFVFGVIFFSIVHIGETESLDDLLNRIQQTYEHTQSLSADFIQVAYLRSVNREQTSAGRLYIQKPNTLRWEYGEPDAQTILYKNNTLQIYTPKRHQVLQSVVKDDERGNISLLFLTGLGTLKHEFLATPLPSSDSQITRLRLVPRSFQANFTELQLSVNRQTAFIQDIIIYDRSDNQTHISFKSLQIDPALPEDTFVLKLPADTEVISQTFPQGR